MHAQRYTCSTVWRSWWWLWGCTVFRDCKFLEHAVFFSLLILSETVLYYVYYVLSRSEKNNGDIESIEEVKSVRRQENLSLDIDIEELRFRLTRPVKDKLREVFLDSPEVFDLLDQMLDLSRILRIESAIIHKKELYHQKATNPLYIRLLINLERVNNIRWVNRYLFILVC